MHSDRSQRRSGFTVLELLVTIAIIGVLAALLLPAIMYAREAARRTQCVNNLKQVGIAIEHYHDSVKRLPAAWKSASDGVSGYGWAVELLPYLEQANIHQRIASTLPITAAQNNVARTSDIALLRCPSDISEPTFELYPENHASDEHHAVGAASESSGSTPVSLAELPIANYAGVFGTIEADETFPAPHGDGPIVSDRRVRFQDLLRGQSHTILVGERTTAMVPTTWYGVSFRGEDAACRLVGSAMTAPSCDFCDECEFASRHSGGANFLWADGHVSLVSHDIDEKEYQQLAKRRAD
jgi:prepilin-type processing-associated H-X9-DG protein/prepilin-type N-terminal cleavage/methylation domain-containing protein